ncbi:hypothetical protein D3C85_1057210 [compost metagenome]
MPRTMAAPAASSRSKYQAEDTAGSISTFCPDRASSAAGSASGASSVTASPSQPGSSLVILAGSRKTLAVPSAFTTACPSGRGVRITSPPRMLNSQASDDGEVSTATSAPLAAMALPMRARFSAAFSPE